MYGLIVPADCGAVTLNEDQFRRFMAKLNRIDQKLDVIGRKVDSLPSAGGKVVQSATGDVFNVPPGINLPSTSVRGIREFALSL